MGKEVVSLPPPPRRTGRDGGRIGLTAVNGDLLRHAVAAHGFRQKAQRGLWIPVLRAQNVDGLALRLPRARQIPPLPCDADVGLVHPPTHPHRALAAVEGRFQLRAVLQDPAIDRGVVDGPPPLLHAFFALAVAYGIGQVPPHAGQANILDEMGS